MAPAARGPGTAGTSRAEKGASRCLFVTCIVASRARVHRFLFAARQRIPLEYVPSGSDQLELRRVSHVLCEVFSAPRMIVGEKITVYTDCGMCVRQPSLPACPYVQQSRCQLIVRGSRQTADSTTGTTVRGSTR